MIPSPSPTRPESVGFGQFGSLFVWVSLGPSMDGLCRTQLTLVGALTLVWVGLLPPVADMAEIQPSRTSVPESYSFHPLALPTLGKNMGIPPGVSGHTRTNTRTNTCTRMVGVGNHMGMSHSILGYTCTWVYLRVLHFYWSSVGICSKCVCSMFTMCS